MSMNTNETDKELTLEELEKLEAEAALKYKELNEKLTKRKVEEEEARKKALEGEKLARYKEVKDAYKKAEKLCKSYVKDYGRIEIANVDSCFFDSRWDRLFF